MSCADVFLSSKTGKSVREIVMFHAPGHSPFYGFSSPPDPPFPEFPSEALTMSS